MGPRRHRLKDFVGQIMRAPREVINRGDADSRMIVIHDHQASQAFVITRATPRSSDWVYVNNFADPDKPAIELPAGRGRTIWADTFPPNSRIEAIWNQKPNWKLYRS